MQAVSMVNASSLAAKKTKDSPMAWVITLTASLFFFYVFIQLNIFNAIDMQLMQAFHVDAPALGQLGAMFFYGNALFLFPAGMLLDRFSTKKIILLALLVVILGTYWFAVATHFAEAASARFLIGLGASFCFLSCIRLASRWFSSHKMALVTGMIVTMAMLGGLVAQTPMALLSDMVGWRQAMLMDVALGVMVFIAIAIIVKDYPEDTHDKIQAEQTQLKQLGLWRSIRLVFFNSQNWFGGIYTALLNLPVFLLGAIWGIHYLMQVHHITLIQASYATTLFFVGVILGSPTFGWLSDRLSRRVLPMIIGAIVSTVVILILMYAPHLSLSNIMILFFLIGFVTSSQVLSYPIIAELNPSALTSTAISIVSVSVMMSGIIFQPLFGFAMQWHWNHAVVNGVPEYAASDFMNGMLMMPIAFVIGVVIAFFLKETYCKSRAET